MNGDADKIRNSKPARLARLLEFGGSGAGLWGSDEFHGILKHQLAARILDDARRAGAGLGKQTQAAVGRDDITFGEALLNPESSVALLKAVQDFAKVQRHDERTGIPMEIATILYYTAIGSAFCHHSERITRLSDASLRRGWSWIVEQEWIPDSVKAVSKAALLGIGNE